MFGATEHILSSSLSHSVGTRCAVRAKMAGSWAVRIPVHGEVGTASSRMIPCSKPPAPSSQLRLTSSQLTSLPAPSSKGQCDISGDAVKPVFITIIRSGSLGWGGPGAEHPTDGVLASEPCNVRVCTSGQAQNVCTCCTHAGLRCGACTEDHHVLGPAPHSWAGACFRPSPTPPGNAIY